MTVSDVVGMNGAEALQSGGGKRNAWRATDVLHLLHLTNTPLEYTAHTAHSADPKLPFTVMFVILRHKAISKHESCKNFLRS